MNDNISKENVQSVKETEVIEGVSAEKKPEAQEVKVEQKAIV